MATVGKARLKKLLTKGLTGWEAGILIFQEGLHREEGGPGWLTDSEIATIRNSLSTREDIEGYNNFRDTAIVVDRTTHQACFGGMAVLNRLLRAQLFLKDCLWHWRTREARHWGPLIVTRKQYQDIKAEHRKTSFNEDYPIDQVLAWRAMEIAPNEVREKLHYPADLEEQYPDLYGQLYQQAKGQIKELIKCGKIALTHYEGDFSKRERSKIRALEDKSKGGLTNEEWEVLIDKTYISGGQLYNSGLPEWPRWINGEEDFLQRDDCYQVAIIQSPGFYQVDGKGYYKDPEEEFHDDPWFLNTVNKRLRKKGTSYTQTVQTLIYRAEEDLARFLAFRTAIEDFFRVTVGVKYYGIGRGNLEACSRDIVSELESLNREIKALQDISDLCKKSGNFSAPVINASKLETIDITKIKPEAELLKKVRKWIADEGIGENWWKRAGPIPEDWMDEEEPEEASLMAKV